MLLFCGASEDGVACYRMSLTGFSLRVLGVAGLAVCGAAGLSQTQSNSTAQLPDAPSTTAQEAAPAVPTGPTVLFDTTMGRLTCKLFAKESPKTVDNFIGLATGTKTWTDPITQQKVTGKPLDRKSVV